MEIGKLVAICFNGLTNALRHLPVRGHVEQDSAGVAD
jgi:hypothetical protein